MNFDFAIIPFIAAGTGLAGGLIKGAGGAIAGGVKKLWGGGGPSDEKKAEFKSVYETEKTKLNAKRAQWSTSSPLYEKIMKAYDFVERGNQIFYLEFRQAEGRAEWDKANAMNPAIDKEFAALKARGLDPYTGQPPGSTAGIGGVTTGGSTVLAGTLPGMNGKGGIATLALVGLLAFMGLKYMKKS